MVYVLYPGRGYFRRRVLADGSEPDAQERRGHSAARGSRDVEKLVRNV